jgi:hypothetical protein
MAKKHGYTRERGYTWRVCPFSFAYQAKHLEVETGQVRGPTQPSGPYADHPYTNGTMNMKNNGGSPGFTCLDDACPYYLDNGVRYFEL